MVVLDTVKWQRVQRPWLAWDEPNLRRNLGVYVHIPFCLARCGYCDFLTFGAERPPELSPASYSEILLEEIRGRGQWLSQALADTGRCVDTVFIGGGTPTCLPPPLLTELMRAINEHFPFGDSGIEFTVEANPDTLSREYITAVAAAGVTRLSAGIQATQARHLRFLGRTHRWNNVRPVLAALRAGPIRQVSFDLLYGIPRLTMAELKESLHRLMGLRPTHLSAYELTCEPGTPYARWLARHPAQEVSADRVAAQQQTIARVLGDYGLYRYEVSSYAKPGAECRHNLRYWRGGDYIGVGLGAASRVGSRVINNPREFDAYQQSAACAGAEQDPLVAAAQTAKAPAPPADAFLRLRTRRGIPRAEAGPAASWLQRGWVRIAGGRIEITNRGLSFADLLARQQD